MPPKITGVFCFDGRGCRRLGGRGRNLLKFLLSHVPVSCNRDPEETVGPQRLKLIVLEKRETLKDPVKAEHVREIPSTSTSSSHADLLKVIKQAVTDVYPTCESFNVYFNEKLEDDLGTDDMPDFGKDQSSGTEWVVHVRVKLPSASAEEPQKFQLRRGRTTEDRPFQELSRGGFGAVYRSQDGKVALKLAVEREQLKELEREFQFLLELKGVKNVIQVQDWVEVCDPAGKLSPGILMELGTQSAESLRSDANSWADATFFMQTQIAAALHFLHSEKHIVHMDIKPANIILTHQVKNSGSEFPAFVKNAMMLKIADFGSAGRLGEKVGAVTKGFIHVEVEEMRLKNIHGLKVHRKYDFYALGKCMFAKPPQGCQYSWLELRNWNSWFCNAVEEYAHLIYQAVKDLEAASVDPLIAAAADQILRSATWATDDEQILPDYKEAQQEDHGKATYMMTRDQKSGELRIDVMTFLQASARAQLNEVFQAKPLRRDGLGFFRVHETVWGAKQGLNHCALATAAILQLLRSEILDDLRSDSEWLDRDIRNFTAARLGRLGREPEPFLDVETCQHLLDLKVAVSEETYEIAVWILDLLLGLFHDNWSATGRMSDQSNRSLDDPIKKAFVELTGCTTFLISAPHYMNNSEVLTPHQVFKGSNYFQAVSHLSYQFPAAIMAHVDRDKFEPYDAQIPFIDKEAVQETWDDGAAAVQHILAANGDVHLTGMGTAAQEQRGRAVKQLLTLLRHPSPKTSKQNEAVTSSDRPLLPEDRVLLETCCMMRARV